MSICWATSRHMKKCRLSCATHRQRDRKSTRLNSSHLGISYAVFCLKKKKIVPEHVRDHWILRQRLCPASERGGGSGVLVGIVGAPACALELLRVDNAVRAEPSRGPA